jgi:hypothetical protein
LKGTEAADSVGGVSGPSRPALPAALLVALLALALAAGPAGAGGRQEGAGASIIGGSFAARGDYPWMTTLIFPRAEQNAFRGQFCGGSLIAPRRVLTAAHCVLGFRARQIDTLVGSYNLRRGDGERIHVSAISVHPAADPSIDPRFGPPYDVFLKRFDVALLQLSRPAAAAPVPIVGPTQGNLWDPGSTVRAIGHGWTNNRGRRPNRLKQVDLRMVSDGRCARLNRGVFHRRSMVCAAAPGKDSCAGDSGGPLVARQGAAWVQVASVSFGARCADPRHPGVYGRLARMRGFLFDPTPARQPEFTGRPAVAGEPRVGNRLRCRSAKWSGKGLRFRYIWGVRTPDPFLPPGAPPIFVPVRGEREHPFFRPRSFERGTFLACMQVGETDGGVMTTRSDYVGPVRRSGS